MNQSHLKKEVIMYPAIFAILFMSITLSACSDTKPSALEREKRIQSSAQWNGDKFQNTIPVSGGGFLESFKLGKDFIFNKPPGGSSDIPLPAEKPNWETWPEKQPLQLAWLGHSTYLLKLEGKWIITDPMFSKAAGPIDWLSPNRYSKLALKIEDLPPLDLVLITHDHYDHLDKASIQALKDKVPRFITPLAVGQYLEDWGVAPDKITELDWWEDYSLGSIKITSTPARHFSGRGILDRNSTLWSSYAIAGKKTNLFLSGDSGIHEELKKIGKELGPFDVTIFEMGAYGTPEFWKQIHLTPEEAIEAHRLVRGKVMIPSHWGTFDLAMFAWHEPIERYVTAAEKEKINYLTPKIGERINPGHIGGKEKWWRVYIDKKND